ncbi:dihydrolipoamide acetyltransferase family protein [Spongorhabdus nitratireducens]
MKFFKLPDLGEGIPEADIVEWKISEGDEVKEDQIIVAVETAKAVVDVPSPCDGVVEKLFGQPGDTIHTGEPLVGFAGDEEAGTVVGKIEEAVSHQDEDDDFIIGAAAATGPVIKATPAVRALARQLKVDLNTLAQSSGGKTITAQDVEAAAKPPALFPDGMPLKGVRKHMARTMAQSHEQVSAVTLFDEVDIHHWKKGEDITIRLLQAIVAAANTEPALNAWFDGPNLSVRQHKSVDIGVAVDSPQGLFVPVLRHAEKCNGKEMRQRLDELRAGVADRSIPQEDLQGATITLSNFGTIAGRFATPVVVPPMVCIIGVGRIHQAAVAVEGNIEAHKTIPLSLTFDHRAATGGEAARFLAVLIEHLKN